MTTGKELRDFLRQVNLEQADAAIMLDGVNPRTVRAWCGAPSKRCKAVPDWVIPRLAEMLGRTPHPNVDKFVIGKGITGKKNDRIYLIHTQAPRFCCVVSPVNNSVDNTEEGPAFACGNRLFHHFIILDTPLDGIKSALDQAAQIMDDRSIAVY